MNIDKRADCGPFLFITNPKSGIGAFDEFKKSIARFSNRPDIKVVESKSEQHTESLCKSAVSDGYRSIVAVGGDGTVHSIGAQLINKDISFGIIPTGSGNGIARHLGISQHIPTAIKQILSSKSRLIDTLLVNEHPAIGFCGVGFDGYVAKLFDISGKRGFRNYINLSYKAYRSYQDKRYLIDGIELKAFSVIIANINQFGNDAFINAHAIDDDGKFEVITINRPPFHAAPSVASRLFLKTFHESRFVTRTSKSYLEIDNLELASIQIDGETLEPIQKLKINIVPKSLNVLVS